MDPKILLIITLVGIAVALSGVVWIAVNCYKAAKKLKGHGEKIFNQKN